MNYALKSLPWILALGVGSAAVAQTPTIAFKAGNILVSDPDTMLIEEYTPNGTFIRSFGLDTDLNQTKQLLVGPHGVLYVACYSPGKVVNGYWRPTKASGVFNFSRNGKTFRGVIKTKGLLNG
jgi:hypothetical protein